jgi:hypothetical protein
MSIIGLLSGPSAWLGATRRDATIDVDVVVDDPLCAVEKGSARPTVARTALAARGCSTRALTADVSTMSR